MRCVLSLCRWSSLIPLSGVRRAIGERRRRLSFAGLMHAEPDLAARSEEIFREERGRQAE
jgi:hypothetical protein